MTSLDVRKEYACPQPAPSEVEGSILARLASDGFMSNLRAHFSAYEGVR
jgi:hypothetical protein